MDDSFILSLADAEGLIYIILATIALYVVRKLWQAYRDTRGAVFGLERELAYRNLSRAIAGLVIIVALAFGEFVLAGFIAPTLPANAYLSTATLDLLAVPTGTLPAEFATAMAGATQAPLLAGTSNCIPGRIEITSPQPDDPVNGTVELIGTVNPPAFGFYKYEFSKRGTQVWSPIQAGNQPKIDESLGFWDTTELEPGDYLLRLVVTDNNGNNLDPCVVPIRVVR